MDVRRCCLQFLVVLIGAVILASTLAVADADDYVVPPDDAQALTGYTYSEWGDLWWQWACSIPNGASPFYDPTGVKAAVGQGAAMPVFFLVGLMNEFGTVERSITIPEGKFLFFPLVNLIDSVLPMPGCPAEPCASMTPEEIYDYMCVNHLDPWRETVADLYASLDGQPLDNPFDYAFRSEDVFSVWYPSHNIFDWAGCPTGRTDVNVSDGWWLMLYPLSGGEHTVQFGGSYWGGSLDITYHITVR
jgi:hypothetical protein